MTRVYIEEGVGSVYYVQDRPRSFGGLVGLLSVINYDEWCDNKEEKKYTCHRRLVPIILHWS